jgi:two-component system chemotaxis response regulator CheY
MPLNILIVDDSSAIRKILIRVLRQTALAIVSEINMPNMDGLSLLAKLKADESSRHLPVMMITTEGNEEKVAQAIRLGSVACMRTPFTAEQIQQKIRNISL